jgi:2-iminoacetate synthase
MSTSFEEIFATYSWSEVADRIQATTESQVHHALATPRRSCEDLMALLSPAAEKHLEEMAQQSHTLTKRHFGKTIQMYAPLYLSNECTNICTYCGFSLNNKIDRLTLNQEQMKREAQVLRDYGFEHVLLVTGESARTVGVPYFQAALDTLRPYFSHLSMEVQPLEEEEYALLRNHGLNTVLVYQETYHRDEYRTHHKKGKKAHFSYRLATPERLGRAGIHKIGLGVLLGLEDWRTDLWFLGRHLAYLRKNFWRSRFSLSFPRLRPAEGVLEPKVIVTERHLVQALTAFRLFDPHVELSLSTRESVAFRDNAIRLGVTSMSAGSRTEPGGYALNSEALEQFSTSDERSVAEVAEAIKAAGYDPVWKDWDKVYDLSNAA